MISMTPQIIFSASTGIGLGIAAFILYRVLGELSALGNKLREKEAETKELTSRIKSFEQETTLLNRRLEEQAKEIRQKESELEQLYEATLSRELKMSELKNKLDISKDD